MLLWRTSTQFSKFSICCLFILHAGSHRKAVDWFPFGRRAPILSAVSSQQSLDLWFSFFFLPIRLWFWIEFHLGSWPAAAAAATATVAWLLLTYLVCGSSGDTRGASRIISWWMYYTQVQWESRYGREVLLSAVHTYLLLPPKYEIWST